MANTYKPNCEGGCGRRGFKNHGAGSYAVPDDDRSKPWQWYCPHCADIHAAEQFLAIDKFENWGKH